MLDGTKIVREVEAVGARHAAAGAGLESEFGLAAEEGGSCGDGREDWDDENWVEGTGVDQVGAGVKSGTGAGPEAELAPDLKSPGGR